MGLEGLITEIKAYRWFGEKGRNVFECPKCGKNTRVLYWIPTMRVQLCHVCIREGNGRKKRKRIIL